MSTRCVSLTLLACSLLFVTGSFAATKKSERHRNVAAEWREDSLQNGSPQDIARTALFLAQDAPYITGQIIAVDGGRSI